MHKRHVYDVTGEIVDRQIAQLAARQNGVVSIAQLRDRGVTRTMLAVRIRAGRLHPVHPRVYAVGHPGLSFEGRALALLLSAGPGAFISGHAALYLRGITSKPPNIIEVVVTKHTRPLRGSRVIHTAHGHPDESGHHRGRALASPARALLDIASTTSELRLTKLIYECAYYDLGVPIDIDRIVDRYPRRAGVTRLRGANKRHRDGSAGARSALEEDVVDRLRRTGAPMPLINQPARMRRGSLEVDLHWPELSLVVEIDGVPHARVESRRRDAARAKRIRAAGWALDRIRPETIATDVARVVEHLTNAQMTSIRRHS
jgi:hypothetical protein